MQPKGKFSSREIPNVLPGYINSNTILLEFDIPGGIIQLGDSAIEYEGIQKKAYLPNNKRGSLIHKKLKICWERRMLFTIENESLLCKFAIEIIR